MFSLFISAFLLGIVANLHCVGMCGPIALALPLKRNSNIEIIIGVLQYNFGRIFTYTLLGFLIGFIGLGINLIGILQYTCIIAGIGIILYAWRKKIFTSPLFNKFQYGKIGVLTSKYMGKIIQNKSPFQLILFGILNGLLPCGMIYTALITSITTGSPLFSAYTLFFFGLGTLPGMILISIFANQITSRFKGKINKILPFLVTIIGLLIILRGMNLNIPYLSPKAKFNERTKELKMEDCH